MNYVGHQLFGRASCVSYSQVLWHDVEHLPEEPGWTPQIMLSDGCKGDAVLLAVDQWYDFHEFGCHLGNVGPTPQNPPIT